LRIVQNRRRQSATWPVRQKREQLHNRRAQIWRRHLGIEVNDAIEIAEKIAI
jgi:hypothetical protein